MSTIEVRPLHTAAQMSAASTVYQRAFGYAPGETAIPPKLLLTLSQHGGLVLGAFRAAGAPGADADGELIGFSYAFLARDPVPPGADPGELYLFSQSTAVLPGVQSTGIGRRLKLAQREQALAAGIELIRWTFDPLRSRNAHLNFDVLGASSGTLLVDYYGVDAVGRDSGVASDRLLVDWRLTGAPRTGAGTPPAGLAGVEPGRRSGDWLVLPADWDGYRGDAGAERAEQVRLAVRAGLADAFGAGQRAVACQRVGPDRAAYLLA